MALYEQLVRPTTKLDDNLVPLVDSDFTSNFLAGGSAFDTAYDDTEELELSSYTFDSFLGSYFDPFALLSGESTALIDAGNTGDGWSIGLPNNEVTQPAMDLWGFINEEFLAPENETSDETSDEPPMTTNTIIEPETPPTTSTSTSTEHPEMSGGKHTNRPSSKKTGLTSGQMARKREVPEECVTTQNVTVTELLNRVVSTTPYAFTNEDKARFLQHVRLKQAKAALSMLPDNQKAVVLDTPQDIAAYRAVHPPSRSLKNVEEKLWVCRASVKVVRTEDGEDIGQVEQLCDAVGSWDSFRRHWRRSHRA